MEPCMVPVSNKQYILYESNFIGKTHFLITSVCMSLFMYVCMYVYMYVCMYVCECIYVCMYVCV